MFPKPDLPHPGDYASVKERIEKEQEAENIAETKGLVTDEGLDPDEDVLE